MSEIDKNLSAVLETEFIEEEPIQGEIVPVVEGANLPVPTEEEGVNRDIEYDYEYSRETHRELIDQGQEALTQLLAVAKESQHPRAYEVAANMLKSLSDMTDKLMALQKAKKDLEGGGSNAAPKQTVNVDKAVFVGSTADLLDKITKQ